MGSCTGCGLLKVVAYIPGHNKHEITYRCVEDCIRERVRTVVIDNASEPPYAPLRGEQVIRNETNTGWLVAANQALAHAMETGCHPVVLNNDVRLSHGFFFGITAAFKNYKRAGIVVPLYNDWMSVAQQARPAPEAEAFKPNRRFVEARYCDGTAIAFRLGVVRRLGKLDENFLPSGWGAEVDYCHRISQIGYKVIVTHLSYVQHMGAATAAAAYGGKSRYTHKCIDEVRKNMARKYGEKWYNIVPYDYWTRHMLGLE